MNTCSNCSSHATYSALIARVLLSSVFIILGITKILGFDMIVGLIDSVGLPMPEVLTVLTIIVEIGAGLMVLLGFMPIVGAWLLIGFTALATFFFHMNISDPNQLTMFLKNLAIIGGLLMVVTHGPGRFALHRCATCPCCRLEKKIGGAGVCDNCSCTCHDNQVAKPGMNNGQHV